MNLADRSGRKCKADIGSKIIAQSFEQRKKESKTFISTTCEKIAFLQHKVDSQLKQVGAASCCGNPVEPQGKSI